MATTYPWSRERPSEPASSRLWHFIEHHLPGVSVGVMVFLLIFFVLYPYVLITVPSGQAGVLWKRFTGPGVYCWCINPSGTVLNPAEIRKEGLHFIWPWDRLYLYDLRMQSASEKYNAISSDGVSVTAEINLQYQLNFDSTAVLHEFVGPDYLPKLLAPQIRSQTRLIISKYTAEQVYLNDTRALIEKDIKEATQASLKSTLDNLFEEDASNQTNPDQYRSYINNAVRVLNTLVLGIELPNEIVSAINSKTQQYYKIKEYEFRVQSEAQESMRKQIEADGIAAFQKTVSQGISDSYLRWQGIQATLALAQSQNSKIVIMGNKDGLPLILGNIDPPSNPPPKPNPNPSPNPNPNPSSDSTPHPPASTITATGRAPGPDSSPTASLTELQAIISRLTGTDKK